MHLSYAGPDLSARQKRLVKAIEWLSRGRGISAVRQRFVDNANDETFFRRAAAAFDLKPTVWFAPRAYIPAQGPLLVVANHPYGVVDGLAISAMLESVRPDIRIIVWNAIGLPPSASHFMPLDLSEHNGSVARRQNVDIRRKATAHLRNGGCVVLFPSGSAEITAHPLARPAEAPWTPLACKLALKSGATILPVFVHGHNSRLFHAASHMGDLVRRSLFLTETRRKIGARIPCRIGEPLLNARLQQMHAEEACSTRQMAARLREMTLQLGKLTAPAHQWTRALTFRQGIASRSAPSFSTGIRSSLVTPICNTISLATKMEE
ncbi:1-acyl-sn-glycerol-3-phosphate acyltransferase [Granulosicoccus sp. 3-233]|uniref:1-acyl-sn-glycerol-3-phosphate acyltransferase n=1 Tax=Granulosicoccus sp. 3-233 TaxID=3417969 RepID=UPI003D352970